MLKKSLLSKECRETSLAGVHHVVLRGFNYEREYLTTSRTAVSFWKSSAKSLTQWTKMALRCRHIAPSTPTA